MRINDTEVRIPEITFGMVCKLQNERGIDLRAMVPDISEFKEFAILTFLSLAYDNDEDKAAKAVDQYLANGGDFIEIVEEINRAIEESRFFQGWMRTAEKLEALQKSAKKKK